MARYHVEWIERIPVWCVVEAESEEEAIEKKLAGEVIEGTQDSEPGRMDRRTIRAWEESDYKNGR